MKDSISNSMALLFMIGQCEEMFGHADMGQIAAYAGVSKQVIIERVFKLCYQGYVHVHASQWRGNAVRFVVTMTDNGWATTQRPFAQMCYKDWRKKSEHVRNIRIGSQKSMFV